MKNTESAYKPGAFVRFSSPSGACLTGTVIRANRTTYTINFYGSKHMARKAIVHAEPCRCCSDHPQSQYRMGRPS